MHLIVVSIVFIMGQIVEMYNYHIYIIQFAETSYSLKIFHSIKNTGGEGVGGVIWSFKLNEITFLNIDKIIHFKLEPFMFKKLVS